MPIQNIEVAAIFEEIVDRLEIQNANPFRIRSYRKAARNLRELPQDIRVLVKNGRDLTEIPGIGDDLVAKIAEIINTGGCSLLNRLSKELPAGIKDLLNIRGMGPKRVKTLYQNLDIKTLEQLYRAARDGRIRKLVGFGNKTEQNLLKAVEDHEKNTEI
jgi:DNA polymerase (family 10)